MKKNKKLRFILMALLRAKKEINETPKSLVLALPNELFVDIVGKVANFQWLILAKSN
jgi:hypothetical protein